MRAARNVDPNDVTEGLLAFEAERDGRSEGEADLGEVREDVAHGIRTNDANGERATCSCACLRDRLTRQNAERASFTRDDVEARVAEELRLGACFVGQRRAWRGNDDTERPALSRGCGLARANDL